jgi:ribosomal protein S18 acetylase RimI-like enzyme
MEMRVREIEDRDRDWVRRVTAEHWGGPTVVVHGAVYRPEELPGFVAVSEGARVGVVTFERKGEHLEVVTIASLEEGRGIGSALLDAALGRARAGGAAVVRLVTTNDNLPALRFFERRGFCVVRVDPGAVERSRRLKPEIPETGVDGIPILDEIVLERKLGGAP